MRIARVTCVLGLSGGMLAGCGGSRPATTTTATVPAPAAVAAAAQGLASPSTGYTDAYVVSVPSAHLSASGHGAFDFRDQTSDQSLTAVGGQTPALQEGKPVRAIVSGKLLYILYPPQIRARQPKPWISFTAAQYNAYAGHRGGLEAIHTPFQYGAPGIGGQYANYLFIAARTFRSAGRATIDGVATTRYDGTLGSFSVQATIPKPFREQRGKISVFIDGQGRVKRIEITGTGVHSSSQRFAISSWAIPKITAPPADQVVTEPASGISRAPLTP